MCYPNMWSNKSSLSTINQTRMGVETANPEIMNNILAFVFFLNNNLVIKIQATSKPKTSKNPIGPKNHNGVCTFSTGSEK